jgi:hypothetical protein
MPVGIDDAAVHVGMGVFQPRGQRRTKIIVDFIKIAGLGIGTITFGGNLLIEVGIRRGSGFNGEQFGKWVLARRLIKMPMQTQVCRAEF